MTSQILLSIEVCGVAESARRSARSFGSPGAGGAMGFADPESGIGYGYVTSQMGIALTGDPRDVALRDALDAAIPATAAARPRP